MKQQFNYVVTLDHPGRRWIVITCHLLLLLGVLAVLQPVMLGATSLRTAWPALPVLAFWAYAFFRRGAEKPPSYRWALGVTALMVFYATGSYLLAFLYFAAAVGLGAAAVQPEIGFNSEGLVINNLVPRRIGWSELRNALIKDDILTVDFKNEKLLQRNLSDPISPELTEEFNSFCQERLKFHLDAELPDTVTDKS